ncbi:MAG TPA: hypothetical protein VLW53_01295 [Candidatus Eisenbacteria bacterium]|nr:hypothetical protein [Candidatus Eisenbacteria bacterium]
MQACRLLELGCSWRDGQAGHAAARDRIRAAGYDPSLVTGLAPLLGPGRAAVLQVVDAQYGGILAVSASVLAVVEQWVRQADGSLRHTGDTFDIRLVAARPRWRVTEVNPARPGSPAATLTPAARAVLGNARIRLPDAAHADVRSGQIHASVLGALTALADHYVLDVSVIKSGHPHFVFGTNRVSDHPRGRAVDVWAVDGRRVVDLANRRLVTEFMAAASQHGTWQVGGPVDLDGGGTRFFSDNTHQDHVHLGFPT